MMCSTAFNNSNRISYGLKTYCLDIKRKSTEARTSFPWWEMVFKPSGTRKGTLLTDTAMCQVFLFTGHLEALMDLKVSDWFDVCFKEGHTLALDPESPSFACSTDTVQPLWRYKLFWCYLSKVRHLQIILLSPCHLVSSPGGCTHVQNQTTSGMGDLQRKAMPSESNSAPSDIFPFTDNLSTSLWNLDPNTYWTSVSHRQQHRKLERGPGGCKWLSSTGWKQEMLSCNIKAIFVLWAAFVSEFGFFRWVYNWPKIICCSSHSTMLGQVQSRRKTEKNNFK